MYASHSADIWYASVAPEPIHTEERWAEVLASLKPWEYVDRLTLLPSGNAVMLIKRLGRVRPPGAPGQRRIAQRDDQSYALLSTIPAARGISGGPTPPANDARKGTGKAPQCRRVPGWTSQTHVGSSTGHSGAHSTIPGCAGLVTMAQSPTPCEPQMKDSERATRRPPCLHRERAGTVCRGQRISGTREASSGWTRCSVGSGPDVA